MTLTLDTEMNAATLEISETDVLDESSLRVAVSVTNRTLDFNWTCGDYHSPEWSIYLEQVPDLICALQWITAGPLGRLAIESEHATATGSTSGSDANQEPLP